MKMKASSALRDYYYLTKPGIIRGNVLTAGGGFFLAAAGTIVWGALAALIIGTICIIGSACVCNNYFDRDIDRAMTRTRNRALVSGRIKSGHALIFGAILGILGVIVLALWTNWLTVVIGAVGWISYVCLYTPAKHRTPYATLIGTIPGATPPVAGYTAITGQLDITAWLLFFILVAWQMPHFYAIAIRRLDEYKKAHVPVWPAVHGIGQTKSQTIGFMVTFIILVAMFSLAGYGGPIFGIVLSVYGLYWLTIALRRYNQPDDTAWAKTVFLLSLPVLPLFSLLLIIGSFV